MGSITSLMDREHRQLINLLDKFLHEFNKKPVESGMILEEFKLFLIKHFSVEEMAIFTVLGDMNSESIESTFELMQEHQEMMALLSKIQKELGKEVEKDVIDLEKRLKAHSLFEDEEFYPELENDLNENQRIQIIARIKEKIQ